ncbi:MAG: PKD domain-containing protein [Pseudomonadales bacterium]|nr:PKD domain-containing protein [Pseudomonadales bacterium]
MSVSTSAVTLFLSGQAGANLVGARVTVKLTDFDIDSSGGGIVAPKLLEFTADANGSVVMNLWSNDLGSRDTQYEINVYHPETGRKILDSVLITVPDSDTTISNILASGTNIRPVAAFTLSPQSGEAPLTVVFDGSTSVDTDGSVIAYEWTVDGTTVGNGQLYTHTFATAGTFSVGLIVTDNTGAVHTALNTIVVSPVSVVGPTAGFTLVSAVAQGSTATATDVSVAGDNTITSVEYDWDEGAGFVAASSYIYVTPASYTVTQRVTDAVGNTDTASQVITVNSDALYVATVAVNALSTAAPQSSFTVTPSSGSGPLRVTVDPTTTTIVGWQAAKDLVDALPGTGSKTQLLADLNNMISELQYVFTY